MACSSPLPVPKRLAAAEAAESAASAPDEVQTEDESDSPVEQSGQQQRHAKGNGQQGSARRSGGRHGRGRGRGGSGGFLSRIPNAVPAVALGAAALFAVRLLLRPRRPAAPGGRPGSVADGRRPTRRPGTKSGGGKRAGTAAAATGPEAPVAEPAPPPPPEPPATLAVYASEFREQPAPLPTEGAASHPLQGLRLAVSEHVAIEGAPLGCGLPELPDASSPAPTAPAPLISDLRSAGAHVAAHCSTQPLNAPTLGDNIRNPSAAWRAAGGGATGAAAAVARAEADLGIGSELLGSVHMPAACMGLCSFAPTPGAASALGETPAANGTRASSGGGVTAAAGLMGGGHPAFIAHDMETLSAVAEALKLPGNPNLRHELTQVVVAEDMFKLCDSEMAPPTVAIKKAVLQWAGQEQAGSVQLLAFLEGNVGRWREMLQDADANGDDLTGPDGGRSPPILRALHRAADILFKRDAWRRHGHLLQRHSLAAVGSKGAEAEQAAAAAEGQQQQGEEAKQQPEQQQEKEQQGSAEEQEQEQQQQQEGQQQAAAAAVAEQGPVLPPEAWAILEEGSRLTDAQESAARAVAAEVEEVIRAAVRRDVVVVAPIVPSPPPRLDAPAPAVTSFLRRARQFAALVSLAGAPTTVLPLGPYAAAGGAPVALALFGQARSDRRLLAVACKLLPLAQAELEKQQQQQPQAGQQPNAQQQGDVAAPSGAAPGSPTRKGGKPSLPKRGAGKRGGSSGGVGSSGGGAAAAVAGGSPPAAATPAAEPPDPKKVERAEKAKARGNELFRKGDYIEAVKAYTEALRHVGDNPVYYSNRAMAYLKAFRFEQAEADCNRALAFDLAPADRVKALLRRGTARQHLYRVPEAAADFRAALKLEPNNRQAREELRAIKQQEEELAAAQRAALLQQRAAGGGGGADDPDAYGALPPGLAGLGGGNGLDGGVDPEAGGPFLSPDEYQRLMASGQVPVLLGEDGRPVSGPRGEPVIVAPDGLPMLIGADGGVTPYLR